MSGYTHIRRSEVYDKLNGESLLLSYPGERGEKEVGYENSVVDHREPGSGFWWAQRFDDEFYRKFRIVNEYGETGRMGGCGREEETKYIGALLSCRL